MQAFSKLSSTIVPLLIDNIDTDQIIPARFLKATSRDGFGQNLFRDWRFDEEENQIQTFPLNNPKFNGEVLFTGSGFGCGSSREHAAWALKDYGFKVILSTNFADIFRNNALNNGLLPIEISESFYHVIQKKIEQDHSLEVHVDLENQTVTFDGLIEEFRIDEFKKYCILHGKDELDFLVDHKKDIKSFEDARA